LLGLNLQFIILGKISWKKDLLYPWAIEGVTTNYSMLSPTYSKCAHIALGNAKFPLSKNICVYILYCHGTRIS
jgi:hypothetical protein